MEHKTDVLPVVERGRIVGQIDRLAIMEALSEIRPDGYVLAMKEPDSTDDLLRRLDADGLSGLATVNRNFEFNAVWGRAEILQAQGKIPQVKIWRPGATEGTGLAGPWTAKGESGATEGTGLAGPWMAQGEPGTPLTPQANDSAAESTGQLQPVFPPASATILAEKPTAVKSIMREPAPARNDSKEGIAPTISIVREAPLEKNAPTEKPHRAVPQPAPGGEAYRGVAENIHREIENGRMAINTLAALDIPLLACYGNGGEIFHNRPFQDIRMRDAHAVKSDELVRRAKDAIADSALKGELDIEKPVRLRQGPRGYDCFCKAIRDFDNPAAKAIGYIFWFRERTPEPFLAAGNAPGDSTPLYSASPGTAGFAGKTLPEILAAEEARAMAWAMSEANGNQSDAALLLGIPRQTFNYRYRKLTRGRRPPHERQQAAQPQKVKKPAKAPDSADGADKGDA